MPCDALAVSSCDCRPSAAPAGRVRSPEGMVESYTPPLQWAITAGRYKLRAHAYGHTYYQYQGNGCACCRPAAHAAASAARHSHCVTLPITAAVLNTIWQRCQLLKKPSRRGRDSGSRLGLPLYVPYCYTSTLSHAPASGNPPPLRSEFTGGSQLITHALPKPC